MKRLWIQIKENAASARSGLTTNTEIRYLNDLLQAAQQQHLAAPLFSLDEVFIPVNLLKPPPPTEPGIHTDPDDVTETIIPYTPDWPQMAAAYNVRGVDLLDAIATGTNIILFGHPGSGKTTCLANLVSMLCRGEPGAVKISHPLPVPIHIHNLKLPMGEGQDIVNTILLALGQNLSPHTQRNLPAYLRSAFQSGKALLIMDGLDEAPPSTTSQAIDFITTVQQSYPSVQFIVATSPENLTSLPVLGFVPLALAAWSENQRIKLIERWRNSWDQFIDTAPTSSGSLQSDLMDAWLYVDRTPLTPIELTLKIWSAFAGDNLGPAGSDAIEAYLRRITVGVPKAQLALQELASQALVSQKTRFTQKEAQEWIFEYDAASSATVQPAASGAGGIVEPITIPRVLPALIECGLLAKHPDSQFSLSHPTLLAYLAARATLKKNRPVSLTNQPWFLQYHSYEYLAAIADLTDTIEQQIKSDQQPLHGEILLAGRWLRLSREDAVWRPRLLRPLAALAQDEDQPICIRARALTALVTTGNTGIDTLLRQMLASSHANARHLAVLSFGMLRDAKSVDALTGLLSDPIPLVFRSACFALVNIGTRAALEAVADCLLQGSEELRRCAAEALANNIEEGHPTLKEGSTIDDLLVRKAVIYGLKRVRQKWAIDIIEKMRLEDTQWVVKNAASEALEDINHQKGFVPQTLVELTETPWLIAFAGEKGIGVAPGKAATDLLLLALKDGKEDQRLAAMDIIRQRADSVGVLPVYQIFYSTQGELREAACNTLWHLAASGIKLPPPAQFGLGFKN